MTRRRTVAGLRAVIIIAAVSLLPGCQSSTSRAPECSGEDMTVFVLMAQAVPSAPSLPCFGVLPTGWRFEGSLIRDGSAQLWFTSPLAGPHAVEIDFAAGCDTTGATEVNATDREGTAHVFRLVQQNYPLVGARFVVFEGGCVAIRYSFPTQIPPADALRIEESISYLPRQDIVSFVRSDEDATLCGADAPACLP